MIKLLTADHVLPISSSPIQNGAVALDGENIAAVGETADLRAKFPDAEIEEFGAAAILPGFVNSHAHLEITVMRGFLDSVEHDFPAWLLKLNAARRDLSDADIETSALAGAVEAARAGVTCIADIGRFARGGLDALKAIGLRGIVYQETEFSPDNKTAADDLKKLKKKFAALRSDATSLVEVGLSPHSPYTVSEKLFELIGEYALAENIKVTIHAAESLFEKTLLERGEGFFIDVYKKFGLEWKVPHCSSIDLLSRTGILKTKPVLVHCVTVSAGDIETIKTSGSAVAHCPRSNAKFGHGFAPLERFLDTGITVGMGSDSVASNNSCDLLEESCFASLTARNRPYSKRFISPAEVLHAATLGGAKALGLDDRIGSLEPGKQADIAVLSLSHIGQQPVYDVHNALVFSSSARDCVLTMVAGKNVFENGFVTTLNENDAAERLSEIRQKITHV